MDPIGDYHKIYFWRTHSGQEVDIVVQIGEKIVPFEVTYSLQALLKKVRNLKAFLEDNPKANFAVYRGPMKFDKKEQNLIFACLDGTKEIGRGRIRTHGTLRYFCFQDRRNRPLCHSSKNHASKFTMLQQNLQ